MKLNNLQKNFFTFFSVIISILIVALAWEKISLPLNNTSAAKGYSATNDTIRYIFFIGIPLFVYLFLNLILKKNIINIKNLFFEEIEEITHYKFYFSVLFVLIVFIFLGFFSINFPSVNFNFDQMHDGAYLTPAQNYLSTNNFWVSSILTHGGSDVFYPLLMWKILGIETIGAARTLNIFLILILKFLTILLAYQFSKILHLNKETKLLFFAIFASILISMSKYSFLDANYYFHHRDIFIILFLIFFIELFINSKLRYLSTFLICVTATSSILLHIDIGIYINFILSFYFMYLLIIKKYKDFLFIFSSIFICWIIAIGIIGFEEFKAFLSNSKAMILGMDSIHGLKYPEPFFSIGDNQDGARATRGLLLQLTAGLFVLNCLFTNKRKLFTSKRIFFIFLFLLSFVMYKNALGRSDAPHIRAANDLPIIINGFFILNYILIFLDKKISNKKFFLFFPIIFILIYNISNNNYKIENIKNFKSNFVNFVKLDDEVFVNKKTVNLIKYFRNINRDENCVEIISYDDAMPYLLKKPSCTKYWASWLVSLAMQKDYIKNLKKVNPKYIVYSSEDIKFDGMGVYERIQLVNSYVLSNYKKYEEIDGYIILEKK